MLFHSKGLFLWAIVKWSDIQTFKTSAMYFFFSQVFFFLLFWVCCCCCSVLFLNYYYYYVKECPGHGLGQRQSSVSFFLLQQHRQVITDNLLKGVFTCQRISSASEYKYLTFFGKYNWMTWCLCVSVCLCVSLCLWKMCFTYPVDKTKSLRR